MKMVKGTVARRATRASSPMVAEKADSTRRRTPVLVKGVGAGKQTTITPDKFHLVDVDRRYQRDRISDEVLDLVYVLQKGGSIPDPVTLARRTFSEPGIDPRKLWIVDGQQRFMAHLELGRAMQAIVYEVESLEAEKTFFLAMNSRVQVSSNSIVHSWPGPVAAQLRTANETPGHPMHDRVQFARGGDKIAAGIIIRSLDALLSSSVNARGSSMQARLSHADLSMRTTPHARERVDCFLRLLGSVFPTSYAHTLGCLALARVAQSRWRGEPYLPSASVLARLRAVNWTSVVPSSSGKFLPIVVSHVEKIWRES
jgi:hypothetical protein